MEFRSESVKIIGMENCGNSPKMELLRDLTIAYATNNKAFCLGWMTEDVVWEIIGDKIIQGHKPFEDALAEIKKRNLQELRIENVLTHGKIGAVNGTILLKNKQYYAFCDVYQFKGQSKTSKIEKITSYIIPSPQEKPV